MTFYNVHLYREMRVKFERVEADTPEAAAAIAHNKFTRDAVDIDDCDGEDLSALVDVIGDDEFEHSVTIDFENERLRKAASQLLAALEGMLEIFVDSDQLADYEDMETVKMARVAIAAATAGNLPDTLPDEMLAALEALLPFAENEETSLYECCRRDGDGEYDESLTACTAALNSARAVMTKAKRRPS